MSFDDQPMPWLADININLAIATACIEQQFPSLAPINIKLIGEGWDNCVYLVNSQWVFRFPRREVAVKLLEQENTILTQLKPLLSIDIPCPQFFGEPSEAFPFPFHGYAMLKGHSGCHAGLKDKQRQSSLKTLALFLKQLHGIGQKKSLQLGAKPQVVERNNVDRMGAFLRERCEKLIAQKFCQVDRALLDDEIAIAQKINLLSEDFTLIHGDLYCRHILFEREELSGIIDWGDSGISHPAIDLGVVHSFYPSSLHQVFIEHYGQVTKAVWDYGRFIGLYISMTMLLYAYNIGDKLLADEGTASIKRINPLLISDGGNNVVNLAR